MPVDFLTAALQSMQNMNVLGQQNQGIEAMTLDNMARKQDLNMRQATQKAYLQSLQPQAPPSPVPSQADDPLSSAQSAARKLTEQAEQSNKLADQIIANGGDPKAAEAARKDSLNAAARARSMMQEARLEQQSNNKRMGEIAGAVTDKDSFDVALNQMRALDPKVADKYQFDRDINNNPVYGPKSQKVMDTLYDTSQSVKDRATQEQKARDAAEKMQNDEALREERKARTRELDAQTALAQVRAGAIKDKPATQSAEEKTRARLAATANRPPTGPMINQAKDTVDAYVKATWPEASFDSTKTAFATDVAAKTNKIRSDYAARGEEISLDDARYEAIEQLKPFVKDTEDTRVGILGVKFGSRGATKTYQRTSTAKAESEVVPMPGSKAELVSGKVYDTPKGRAKWDGEKFTKVD